MSEIKACLFDLDGVIVDTAKYHFKAWKRLANELGIDFTEKENEHLKGVSRIESLQLILKWGGLTKNESELQELATLKNSWYVEMINEMKEDEILPGSRALLTELRNSGIIEQYEQSGRKFNKLRSAHIEAAAPGVLKLVLEAFRREHAGR